MNRKDRHGDFREIRIADVQFANRRNAGFEMFVQMRRPFIWKFTIAVACFRGVFRISDQPGPFNFPILLAEFFRVPGGLAILLQIAEFFE